MKTAMNVSHNPIPTSDGEMPLCFGPDKPSVFNSDTKIEHGWKNQKPSLSESLKQTKRQIFEALKSEGISKAEVNYYGTSDQTLVDEVSYSKTDKILRKEEVRQETNATDLSGLPKEASTEYHATSVLIKYICHEIIKAEYASWRFRGGSMGSFTFDTNHERIEYNYTALPVIYRELTF